ncbi:LysE family transporter [Paraflavisolibacter sp. H34]|uniref:LysE family translocator n=1 Tax=Huijunlia imazamoxiresistens TaxID=3127457 RepID=UPI0030174218
MSKFIRIFFTGMVISFLGSLPLGTLNVAVMQISISDGVVPAFKFAIGALLVELVYVRLSLVAMDWVRKQERLIRILEWATLAIIVALAASSFYAAAHPTVNKNVILSSTLNRFVLGVLMSAINPVQIPFWFGWSTVLFTKKILLPKASHYNTYISGIGLGTFIASCVFVYGGQFIAGLLNQNGNILNWIIGSIFALTALIQVIKMSRKKDPAHQLEHPEEVTHGMEERFISKDEHNNP